MNLNIIEILEVSSQFIQSFIANSSISLKKYSGKKEIFAEYKMHIV